MSEWVACAVTLRWDVAGEQCAFVEFGSFHTAENDRNLVQRHSRRCLLLYPTRNDFSFCFLRGGACGLQTIWTTISLRQRGEILADSEDKIGTGTAKAGDRGISVACDDERECRVIGEKTKQG